MTDLTIDSLLRDGELELKLPDAHPRLARLHELRDLLRKDWEGLQLDTGSDPESLTDWILAGLLARENVLLIGRPGVAKTEIAERIFSLLGLDRPRVDTPGALPPPGADPSAEWGERLRQGRTQAKYFRYLLSRFTQPEELFGPIDIDLLKRGVLVHVNFGLLTGPGVRAAFLDEVFKASSSILNALLTLILEREYFNWGGMMPSDLLMLIAASNELPGGLASGRFGVGSSSEDFNTLYAFLDRFALRIEVPQVTPNLIHGRSALHEATEKALEREGNKFRGGSSFVPATWSNGAPSITDLVWLGRAMLQNDLLMASSSLALFKRHFHELAAALFTQSTGRSDDRVSWTISPRKLKALYKIALAHAVVRSRVSPTDQGHIVAPDARELGVFRFIWDSNQSKKELESLVYDRIRYARRNWHER